MMSNKNIMNFFQKLFGLKKSQSSDTKRFIGHCGKSDLGCGNAFDMTYKGDGGTQIGVYQADNDEFKNLEEDNYMVKIDVGDFDTLVLSGGFDVTLCKSETSYLAANDHNVSMMIKLADGVLKLDRGNVRRRCSGNSIGNIQGSNIGNIVQSGGASSIGGISVSPFDEGLIDVVIYCPQVPELNVIGDSKVSMTGFHAGQNTAGEREENASKRENKANLPPGLHHLRSFKHLVVKGFMDVSIFQSESDSWEMTSLTENAEDIFHLDGDTLIIDDEKLAKKSGNSTTSATVTGINLSGQRIQSISMTGDDMKIVMNDTVLISDLDIIMLNIPRLPSINLTGSGNVDIDGFAGDDINYLIQGSGSIKHKNVQTKKAHITLNGSRGVRLISKNIDEEIAIGTLDINLNGSGNIDLSKCKSERANVNLHGSGTVKVNTNEIKGRILGSGDIVVYKKCLKQDVEIIGTGRIKQK